MDGLTSGWDGPTDVRMGGGKVGGWMDGQMEDWMLEGGKERETEGDREGGLMHGWMMDGWREEGKDRWIDKWMGFAWEW